MSHHSHSLCGITTFNDGHVHHYAGITSKEPSGKPHVHYIEGKTSYNDEHDHDYKTKTGPAVPLPCGGHVHYVKAEAEYEDGHIHYMSGFTSKD